jgi:hypothetical protein
MKKHIQVLTCVALAYVAAADAQGPPAGWTVLGPGEWAVSRGTGTGMRQGNAEGVTSTVCPDLKGTGNVWRCMVEPAPGTEAAGFWFAASKDLAKGCLLTLGGNPDVGGVSLRDAAGNTLWEDLYAPWTYYTPYVLEAVAEAGRARVQMLALDKETLLAQSDWIETDATEAGPTNTFALHTESGVARFYRWQRAETPLSAIVPDSPTKMRLVNDAADAWVIVGGGDWRWTSAEKRAIQQRAKVERTTAINTALGGSEGTWRCRVRPDEGTCGAGMLFNVDRQLQRGFFAWLGGTFGDGGLMLYRMPLDALWSSPQGKWHWDTEYVLEGTIADGNVSVRMLAADGKTIIAESPAMPLTEEERGRPGFVGFQTWHGTAQYWDFSDQTRAVAAVSAEETKASALGPDWSVTAGDWEWTDDTKQAVRQTAASGEATVLNNAVQGDRAVFRCQVMPGDGVEAVGVLFQMSPDLKEGFACRLGKGVQLNAMDGRTLWRKDDFAWSAGKPYIVEGIVVTDRVSIRVLDEKDAVLVQSDMCYVTDANNTRQGVLGFRTENGTAEFTEWSVKASGQ